MIFYIFVIVKKFIKKAKINSVTSANPEPDFICASASIVVINY